MEPKAGKENKEREGEGEPEREHTEHHLTARPTQQGTETQNTLNARDLRNTQDALILPWFSCHV